MKTGPNVCLSVVGLLCAFRGLSQAGTARYSLGGLFLVFWVWSAPASAAVARELVRDPHFQNGFYLLEPKPGKRVVYGQLAGLASAKPVWDLAQWSSRFPLQPGDSVSSPQILVWSNSAKRLVFGVPVNSAADLSLAVNASVEYGSRARKSAAEP
jgi:hypothetical protein